MPLDHHLSHLMAPTFKAREVAWVSIHWSNIWTTSGVCCLAINHNCESLMGCLGDKKTNPKLEVDLRLGAWLLINNLKQNSPLFCFISSKKVKAWSRFWTYGKLLLWWQQWESLLKYLMNKLCPSKSDLRTLMSDNNGHNEHLPELYWRWLAISFTNEWIENTSWVFFLGASLFPPYSA